MAKGEKTGGRNFEPGKSGNPKGRPPLPEDIKTVRSAPQDELSEIFTRLKAMPADEVGKLARSLSTPALERAIAKTLYLAGRSGDPKRLDVILTRMYGRPKAAPDELPQNQGAPSLVELILRAERAKARGDE